MLNNVRECKVFSNYGFSFLGILIVCIIISIMFVLNIDKYQGFSPSDKGNGSVDHPVVNSTQQIAVFDNTKKKLKGINDRNKLRGDEVLELFNENKY